MQILGADPGLFGPRYYMGLMRLQQGRAADAADFLSEALQDHAGQSGRADALRHGAAGDGARRRSFWKASTRRSSYQPNLPEALYNRGVTLADLQRYELGARQL